jgi:hypothetical protein
MATIEELFAARLQRLESEHAHLPSRVRSLLWIGAASPVLRAIGFVAPDGDAVERRLRALLPAAAREPAAAFELAS